MRIAEETKVVYRDRKGEYCLKGYTRSVVSSDQRNVLVAYHPAFPNQILGLELRLCLMAILFQL